jgi:membrane protein YqaA with SNARE-associated domain
VAYIFLFLSAFGAATLLPLQSESVLAGMLILGEYSPVLLIGVATLGNVLGSCVHWWLGVLICAELAGDFHLGYARQLTDKSSLLFDLAF